MSQLEPPPEPTDRLDSWKEIASYLDRSVRSVQRWEKEDGLPVHRRGLPGERTNKQVFAFRSEIDEWWKTQKDILEGVGAQHEHAAPSTGVRWAAVAAVGSVAAVLLVSFTRDSGGPSGPTMELLGSFPRSWVVPSPDGSQAAYLTRRRSHLWLRDLKSGESRPLVEESVISYFCWTPDGRGVTFATYPENRFLETIDIETGRRTLLWEAPLGTFAAFPQQWSPQGSFLDVVIAARDPGRTPDINGRRIFEAATETVERVPQRIRRLAFSADESRVLFQDRQSGAIVHSEPDFTTDRIVLTPEGDRYDWPLFARRSNRSLFVRAADKGVRDEPSLWSVALGQDGTPQGDPTEVAALPEGFGGPVWITDEDDLIFGRSERAVRQTVVMSTRSSSGQVQHEFADGTIPIAWDRDKLYYRRLPDSGLQGQATLYSHNFETGEDASHPLPLPPTPIFSHLPGLKSDLSKMAFIRGMTHELALFDAKTRESETLLTWPTNLWGVGGGGPRLAWSNDGRKLSFAAQAVEGPGYTLQIVDLATNQITPLADLQLDAPQAFSPNDSQIAFVDGPCLMTVSSTGGPAREVLCVESLISPPRDSWRGTLAASIWSHGDPTWSPDGKSIAWVIANVERDRAQLIAIDLETGGDRVLWEGDPELQSWPTHPRWSPDGKRIAFSIYRGFDTELWALRDFLPGSLQKAP